MQLNWGLEPKLDILASLDKFGFKFGFDTVVFDICTRSAVLCLKCSRMSHPKFLTIHEVVLVFFVGTTATRLFYFWLSDLRMEVQSWCITPKQKPMTTQCLQISHAVLRCVCVCVCDCIVMNCIVASTSRILCRTDRDALYFSLSLKWRYISVVSSHSKSQ